MMGVSGALFVMPCRRTALAVFIAGMLRAQLTTGIVEGALRDENGSPAAGVSVVTTGGAGFRNVVRADAQGNFTLVLPYGRYSIGGVDVFVAALEITRVDLTTRQIFHDTIWTDTTRGRI